MQHSNGYTVTVSFETRQDALIFLSRLERWTDIKATSPLCQWWRGSFASEPVPFGPAQAFAADAEILFTRIENFLRKIGKAIL